MFGKERFQSVINDWFKTIQLNEFNQNKMSNNQSEIDFYKNVFNFKMKNPSILSILEQVRIEFT